MTDPTTPEGRAEIRQRAESAQAARNDIHRCEFLRVTPAPYSHRQIAASQADVPALLDALDQAEQRAEKAESAFDRARHSLGRSDLEITRVRAALDRIRVVARSNRESAAKWRSIGHLDVATEFEKTAAALERIIEGES